MIKKQKNRTVRHLQLHPSARLVGQSKPGWSSEVHRPSTVLASREYSRVPQCHPNIDLSPSSCSCLYWLAPRSILHTNRRHRTYSLFTSVNRMAASSCRSQYRSKCSASLVRLSTWMISVLSSTTWTHWHPCKEKLVYLSLHMTYIQ